MRIAFNIALPLAMLFLPWWAFALLLVASFFLVERFFEGMLWGLAADVLHGSSWGYHGFTHAFLAASVALFALAAALRGRLSWQR